MIFIITMVFCSLITITQQRATEILFRVNINQDMQTCVGNWSDCPDDIPGLPFNKGATDLMEYGGEYYLLSVGDFTKWIKLIKFRNKTSSAGFDALKSIFVTHGVICHWMTERAVETMEQILQKCYNVSLGLQVSINPLLKLFNRRLRTPLTISNSLMTRS